MIKLISSKIFQVNPIAYIHKILNSVSSYSYMYKILCLPSAILIAILMFVSSNTYSQSISKVRVQKKKLLKLFSTGSQNKKKLKKDLQKFDIKTLRQLLRDYGLPHRNKNKSKLIDILLDNIKIIVSKKTTGKFPLKRDKKSSEETTTSKSTSQSTSARRDEIQSEEQKSEKNTDYLKYSATQIHYTDKPDKKGFRHIFLFGKVILKFKKKTLYADAVMIKIDKNDDPLEAMAIGDILFVDENNNKMIGEKIYFFPKINRAIIYRSKGYKKPFYMTGETGHQVTKSKYIFYKGIMTSDNLEHPHYSINYSKAWYYDETYVWAYDVTYKVGNTPLLYSPFYFRSLYSTGILTSFGFEKGIGWFMHNSLAYVPGKSIAEIRELISKGNTLQLKKGQGYGMKFKLDYYQRMGLYFGYEFILQKGSNKILFDGAMAIDRSMKYIGGSQIFTNSFDQNGDGIPEETNSIRWKIKYESTFGIINAGEFTSNVTFGFKNQGEPFFTNQFESYRREDFDLWKVFGFDKAEYGLEGGRAASAGTATGQNFKFSLDNKYKGLSFSIGGDWNYILQLDNTDPSNPPKNKYQTSAYKNYKSIFIFPQIKIGFSEFIQIFGKDTPKLKSDKEKEDFKKKNEETEFQKIFQSTEKQDNTKPDQTYSQAQAISNPTKPDEYLNPDVLRKNRLTINLPFTYTFSFDSKETQSFNTSTTNEIASDIFSTTSSVNVSTPFTLTYRFISFKINTTESIRNLTQKTKNASTIQSSLDKELTYAVWSSNLSSSLDLHFFEKYELLELILTGGVQYNYSDRFDKVYKASTAFKNESGRSESYGVNAGFTFLKTKFLVSFNDNLYISAADEERISLGTATKYSILKSQRGNLIFTINSDTLYFLNITDNFTRSRRTDENVSNQLTATLKLVNRNHLFGPFYINSVNLTSTWLNDYQNPRSDFLTTSLNIDFNISRNWNFIYRATSVNRQLYRYSESESSKYGQQSRNFFSDLFDSFNFFKQSDRESSFFNVESMELILKHDLHDWTFEFNLSLNLRRFTTGPYYFQPTIYFVIYLKDLPSFKYPQVKKTFTQQ